MISSLIRLSADLFHGLLGLMRRLGFWLLVILRFFLVVFNGRRCRISSFGIDTLYPLEGGILTLTWELRHAYLLHISNGVGFLSPNKSHYLILPKESDTYVLTAYGLQGSIRERCHIQLRHTAFQNIPTGKFTDALQGSVENSARLLDDAGRFRMALPQMHFKDSAFPMELPQVPMPHLLTRDMRIILPEPPVLESLISNYSNQI